MLCALAIATVSGPLTCPRCDAVLLKWIARVRGLIAASISSFVSTTTSLMPSWRIWWSKAFLCDF